MSSAQHLEPSHMYDRLQGSHLSIFCAPAADSLGIARTTSSFHRHVLTTSATPGSIASNVSLGYPSELPIIVRLPAVARSDTMYRVHWMYAACLCAHTTRPLAQEVANVHSLRQVQFPRLWQAVSQQLVHGKHLRDIIGSCVRALTRRSYQSLTARMTDHLIRDSPRLMVCSSHESAHWRANSATTL